MFGLDKAIRQIAPEVATPYPIQDALRVALILIPGTIILGITLVVLAKYARTWWVDRALANAQGVKSKWRGLLPTHVIWISLSYVGLVLMPMTSVVSRLREPLYSWPRTIAYAVFMLAGIWSLISLLKHQQQRLVSLSSVHYPKVKDSEKGPKPINDDTCP